MAIQVLVVDEHDVVRAGLKSWFQDSDIRVAAEAASSAEALKIVAKRRLNLVLLEVRLADKDGLDCLTKIKAAKPDLPVLMFTGFENPVYLARAAAIGASGYLLKSIKRSQLISSIKEAATGEDVWTREELRRVTGAINSKKVTVDMERPLTKRENEVLKQLAHGLTNKEIAMALGISYETVKEHVQHILRKVSMSDRTQVAVWAVRNGLV